MDDSKRARSGKLRTQPRDRAYVDSLDLQSALQRIRQAACRESLDANSGCFDAINHSLCSFPEQRLRVMT